MAGMFYSRKEAAEKLNKSEAEIDAFVKDGKLREFRHGETLMYKVDEVDALAGEGAEAPVALSDELGIDLEAEESPTPEEAPSAEETPLIEEAPSVEELPVDEEIPTLEETPAPEKAPASEDELLPAPEPSEGKGEEIQLSDADTAIVEEGINVLGETDTKDVFEELKPEEEGSGLDGLAETSVAAADEASLEEIEEDVSLDTFGSGSGLLDLSLQADDTSLGGILDEIYTQEGEGQPAGEEAGTGSAVEMAAEAEQMLPEEEFVEPQPVPAVPAAAAAYVEPRPDSSDKFFAITLILGFLACFYTIAVVLAGMREFVPSILLDSIRGIILYVLGGAFVLAGIVGVAGVMAGSGRAKAPKKPKAKEQKPPKVKKEKTPKPKKEKKKKQK